MTKKSSPQQLQPVSMNKSNRPRCPRPPSELRWPRAGLAGLCSCRAVPAVRAPTPAAASPGPALTAEAAKCRAERPSTTACHQPWLVPAAWAPQESSILTPPCQRLCPREADLAAINSYTILALNRMSLSSWTESFRNLRAAIPSAPSEMFVSQEMPSSDAFSM